MVFAALLTAGIMYCLLYVMLSSPPVQKKISERLERELSQVIGAQVNIGYLNILPFNEVVVKDLRLLTPDGEDFLYIEKAGAAISLFKLISEQKIDISYVEIIGLDASIVQREKEGQYNFQFLIEAFKPKDENKPPTDFDLRLRNIVIRKGAVSFSRLWCEPKNENEVFDFNHFKITDLKADLSFPELSREKIELSLRRLSMNARGLPPVEKLAFNLNISPQKIALSELTLAFGESILKTRPLLLNLQENGNIEETIKNRGINLGFYESNIFLPDLSFLYPPLDNLHNEIKFSSDLYTDLNSLSIDTFKLSDGEGFNFNLKGNALGITDIKNIEFDLSELKIEIPSHLISEILDIVPKIPQNIKNYSEKIGFLDISLKGSGKSLTGPIEVETEIITSSGVNFKVEGKATKDLQDLEANISLSAENVGLFLGKDDIGSLRLTAEAQVSPNHWNPYNINGSLTTFIETLEYQGKNLGGIDLIAHKEDVAIDADIAVDNNFIRAGISLSGLYEELKKEINLECRPEIFSLFLFIKNEKFSNSIINGGDITINASLDDNDNLTGQARIKDISLTLSDGKTLTLERLMMNAEMEKENGTISLTSDWIDAEARGNFNLVRLSGEMERILGGIMPAAFQGFKEKDEWRAGMEFEMLIHPENDLTEFFNLPVKLLVPVEISGYIDGEKDKAGISLNLPYLQQGKDKLIYDTRLNAELDAVEAELRLDFDVTMPAKNGDLALSLNCWGGENKIFTDINWRNPENTHFKGLLSFETLLSRDPLNSTPILDVRINPTGLSMGSEDWHIADATLKYGHDVLEVKGFRVWHDSQFVEIEGKASKSYDDILRISLSSIDVDYVFDTLKINYVTFGGEATGEISGRGIFSKEPIAQTEKLFIKDLSYNGAIIGDGDITSHWNNEEKEVAIAAIISKDGHQRVDGSGGVFLGADSLCFDIKADKVPVEFIQPFMAAFSSHIGGFASGHVTLAGNFHDIDLTGVAFADSVNVKLDYTETYYHGSDSVYLNPGKIIIPGFRLYDRNGNSGLLTGELTHKYFHDPAFTFRFSDMNNFLCYDTKVEQNPDWYGTVYADGSAIITGEPGFVDIGIDVTLVDNSTFNYVLNETQAAGEYNFLTFTDRKKEERERREREDLTDFKTLFKKKSRNEDENSTRFRLGIRALVTPAVLFTLVMDPRAGDKITARGGGAVQVDYNSSDDQMLMFGKYTIDEGNYNFSLQDLILRDFKIISGSSITFNGDPLDADLDISAAYRVNTNLSDLDKSFSTDRDLARTNVPVDAILKVTGDMTSPSITFDIDLPTLTEDVERKVRSIISTDDMMNRQIIYLLALNRFYTPEYMGSTSNGGELAAVASTTLSSQLSNMIGQLTDKVTFSPTFRTDKGDFSDIEVDVALSSRLLNNRLLLNGNFGYRDKSTSTTTFVGDFDLEYLLSKNGNLRLKAYNHFNDQNYYLREALTTQGIGVIFRKDFDNLFNFLKKKKK